MRLLHIKPALVGILRYGEQKAMWLLAMASGKAFVWGGDASGFLMCFVCWIVGLFDILIFFDLFV